MRKIVIISVALGIFALILSVIMAVIIPWSNREEIQPTPTAETEDVTPTPNPRRPMLGWGDQRAFVRILGEDGEISQMSMFDYLIGVVSIEMPVSFEFEALSAQAVAARTYVFHHMLINPPAAHPEADVCGDFTCCAAFETDEQLREKWGDDYDKNIDKVKRAIRQTDGVYITYEDEPILAVFHSSSYIATENAEKVWLNPLPYLKSVPSPETVEEVGNLISTVTVSKKDFKETFLAAYPEAVLEGDLRLWISDVVLEDMGRVETITIGGVTINGPTLRSLLQLRSTAVSITIDGDDIIFETMGYGHGVGMSQYGANIMAKNGSTWREIIKTYYTDIVLSDERIRPDVTVPPSDANVVFDELGSGSETL